MHTVGEEFLTLGARLWAADCFRQAAELEAAPSPVSGRRFLRAVALTMALPDRAPLRPDPTHPSNPLSPRELQVALLSDAPTPTIADRLFISPRTVESHLRRIYQALDVDGRSQLVPLLARAAVPRGIDA